MLGRPHGLAGPVSTGPIGPYELLDQVAAPDGTVWRARDQATGTIVAIRPHPAAPEGTYVVQDWLTGAGIGTLAIAVPTAGAIVAGAGAAGAGAGAAGAAGTAAGAGAAGLSGGAAGAVAPGGAGLSAGAGVPTAAAAGSPTAAAAGATPGPMAASGASGAAAHAGGGGGSVGVGHGLPGSGAHAGVSASKGVVGHIVAHKVVAAVVAVAVAGGLGATAVAVAAGTDDEPQRRSAADRSVASTEAPTATGSATPTDSPSAPTATASATPTMREDEVAAAEIEGRYNATSAGGTLGGTSLPAGSGGTFVLRVVSDCTSGPCTVRVTDGKESLSATGSYDDGAWSGDGTYTASDIDCTSAFEMTLTPSGRDLTLRFFAGDFCGFGAADLRWTMSPVG